MSRKPHKDWKGKALSIVSRVAKSQQHQQKGFNLVPLVLDFFENNDHTPFYHDTSGMHSQIEKGAGGKNKIKFKGQSDIGGGEKTTLPCG